MPISTLGRCLIFSSVLVLAACGGSGSSNSNRNPGDDPPPPPPTESPRSQLYDGLGFAPAQIHEQDITPELGEAVGPGYLVLAGLVAVSNLRLSLQPYNWLIPRLVNSEPEEGEPVAGNCTHDNTIVNHADDNGDGLLTFGENVQFRLGDCTPAGGVRHLSADAAESEQLFQGDRSGRISRYWIDEVSMSGYDGLQFSSDHWLTREYAPDRRECAKVGEEFRECEQMRLDNQAPGSSGDALAQLTIGQHGAAEPVSLRIWSDGETATPGEIHSLVYQEDHAALFRIDGLDMTLQSGDADRSGTYRLETLAEGLRLCHTGTTFVSDAYHLCAGGFRVTVPDGRTYSYRAAEGADPTSLYVTVEDEAGAETDLGVLPQPFLMQRLRLSER